ncbi:MAG: ABC transporter permease, partial [bacterium]
AVDHWMTPQYIIPLAGMFFASSMNSISVSAERFQHEIKHLQTIIEARNHAFNAGLISITNSLFAVGLVSLPGMMTGQILSGVSPLIAVRYQIAIMALIFAASGISSALFLVFLSRQHDQGSSKS